LGIQGKEAEIVVNLEELLDQLVEKAERTWNEYDDEPDMAKSRYLLGKIRGIEYAIALLQAELGTA
jgi:hypothetical protein